MKTKYATFYAVIRKMDATGTTNPKALTLCSHSNGSVASNEAYRVIQAVAFGGYVGSLEIEIIRSASSERVESVWYANYTADGHFSMWHTKAEALAALQSEVPNFDQDFSRV